jgi:hypothetical protein
MAILIGWLRNLRERLVLGSGEPQTPVARRRSVERGRCEPLETRKLLHGNPVLDAEHAAVFNLVKPTDATHVAIASGDWDAADTWRDGVLPSANARVLIPRDILVRLDSRESVPLKTVRVDGTLTFATDVSTQLTVDTLVVDGMGSLIVGSTDNPVAKEVTAKIVIAGDAPIDAAWDPNQLSRGLISHGTLQMHGSATTSYVALAESPVKGSTQLVLAETPIGWDPGERIVVTGSDANRNQDEQLEIAGVSTIGGRTIVTVTTPLLYGNTLLPGRSLYVTNVSRNVTVQSASTAQTYQRGHIMVMHRPTAELQYVGLYGLGRTDKRNPLHNVELDATGALVPGTGKNQVGRYSIHFHRTGLDHDAAPAVIRGSAVVDSPGWGIANHSSHVLVEGNTVFDVVGAAYATEAGDEIGAFRNNIAIRSTGSGVGIESRKDRQDFGHQGDGFWFQGAGVEVEGNVAAGHRHAGFVYFTRGLVEKGLGTARFLAHNLADPSWAAGQETIDVGSVPIRSFRNNEAFASGTGFESWFHLLGARHDGRSVVEGLKVWNVRSGTSVFIPYTNNTTLKDLSLVGNPARPAGTGVGRNDVTRNIVYDNVRAEGFAVGVRVPVNGTNTITGGFFRNVTNIEVTTAMSKSRVVSIDGTGQFGTLGAAALNGRTQRDIALGTNFNPKDLDVTRLFNPDVVLLGTVNYNDRQLFFREQAANFVPFKTGAAASYVPPELLDKTNRQLVDQYGLALGGVVAPENATTDPRIQGLVGDRVSYQETLALRSRKYTNQLTGYRLVYSRGDGTQVRESNVVNLREGWNLLTRTIDGRARTFLVFGDTTGPSFALNSGVALVINPLDLKSGFVVRGTIRDNSTGSKPFHQRFTDLNQLVQTRTDGSQFVVIRFRIRDMAGNVTEVALTLAIDSRAPRQNDLGYVDLPSRPASATLLVLLDLND